MNLGDPELELIDPTPNVHVLFVHFDKLFFWTSLASRAIVRWSKRMYSCAGICSYDRVGLCEIALSEPLLKLRPRKDLIETLLHEMIHAYLFITKRDRDRDGHGPNFQAHMHRINKSAGLNISIYHDFHDEVKLYQTHWWRCNGPCQNQRPYFGIVRRSANRAPGPNDRWWLDHQRKCGGTFVKIKEPEKKTRAKPKNLNGDITKYVETNTKMNKDINKNQNISQSKSVLKDSNINSKIKTQSSFMNNNTLIVNKKKIIFNPTSIKAPIDPFTGRGQTIGTKKKDSISDTTETVRNIWANKVLASDNIKTNHSPKLVPANNKKHKTSEVSTSPPRKVMKIDDYFKNNVKTILNDIYSQEFVVTQTENDSKINILPVVTHLVECPICKIKVSNEDINGHLDECLNKDIIKQISEDTNDSTNNVAEENNSKPTTYKSNKNIDTDDDIVEVMPKIDLIDLTCIEAEIKNNNNITQSKDNNNICPCCGKQISITIQEHLDDCLVFFDNNETMPEEGASSSSMIDTIVLDDDDDEFDETMTLNATGTKTPCPCCLEMVEQADMNDHLDICLR